MASAAGAEGHEFRTKKRQQLIGYESIEISQILTAWQRVNTFSFYDIAFAARH